MGDTGDAFKAMKEHAIEERHKIEPGRFAFAKKNFDKLKMKYTEKMDSIMIEFQGGQIEFWPYTGYFCGRKPLGKIKGRGIASLLRSIGKV